MTAPDLDRLQAAALTRLHRIHRHSGRDRTGSPTEDGAGNAGTDERTEQVMAQSADYKRGYGKGYTTGRGDRDEIEIRHQAELLAVAERAERAESAAGMGHCEDCKHWEQPYKCSWGYCNASRQPGSPWGCWAQGPSFVVNDRYDKGRISTTPRFGCVLFLSVNEQGKHL